MENTHQQRLPVQPHKQDRAPGTDIISGARNEDQLDALKENANNGYESQPDGEIAEKDNAATAVSNPNSGDISNPLTRGI